MDISTLIILAVAFVVLFYLRSILGQKTGHEAPPDFMERMKQREEAREDGPSSDNVVKLPTRNNQTEDEEKKNPALAEIDKISGPRTKLNKALKSIIKIDGSFSPKQFLGGADMAYEMIVDAYARGDHAALKPLLSNDVYKGFSSAIKEREKNGETVKSSFIGIDESSISGAELDGDEASVTVRFISQIVSATYDKAGEVIEGDEAEVVRVKDIWTFTRNLKDGNPNWKLVATESEG